MRAELTDQIIRLEFKQFQAVSNKGGKASCQDNFFTFEIMRKSQFSAWSEPLLESYFDDLNAAEADKKNLPAEKYARMMEETFPEEFAEIQKLIPPLSPKQKELILAIMPIQTAMTEELYERFLLTCAQGRPLFPDPKRPEHTSAMTYLRGELCTYSESTLALYLENLRQKQASGGNLPIEILERTVRFYGYSSLDEHEKHLRESLEGGAQ